jgi:hypothetical protein
MYDALLIQLEKNRVTISPSQAYIFDFGPKELVNMVGLPPGDGTLVLRKMMENKKIQVMKDKIYVHDVTEIAKETAYYRKMQRIEKARRDSASWN